MSLDTTCIYNNCDSNAAWCTNTARSFTCVCNFGCTSNGVTCTSVDECASSAHDCGINAKRTDARGNFTFGRNTVDSSFCACNVGYEGDVVVTQLADDMHLCPLTQLADDIDLCPLTQLAHDVHLCPLTQLAGSGDIYNNCDTEAGCITVGSSSCGGEAGYSGNGTPCADVNECATAFLNNCDTNAACAVHNSLASYTCVFRHKNFAVWSRCGGCVVLTGLRGQGMVPVWCNDDGINEIVVKRFGWWPSVSIARLRAPTVCGMGGGLRARFDSVVKRFEWWPAGTARLRVHTVWVVACGHDLDVMLQFIGMLRTPRGSSAFREWASALAPFLSY